MLSAQLHQELDPGPFLPTDRQVDEGRDAHQIEARGREVTARDSDRLDGLVDSTGLAVGMLDEDSAGTGTAIRAETVRAYATEAGFGRVDVLPIEHDFWHFYRLVP
jgi:hypothetical protein